MLSIESGVLVQVLIGFGVILILIFLLTWIMKKLNLVSARIARQGEDPRLSIKEVIAVDHKRRLLLVQRDHVEHLLLIGGESDLLVEHNIPAQQIQKQSSHTQMQPQQAAPVIQPPMAPPNPGQPMPAQQPTSTAAPRMQAQRPAAPAQPAPQTASGPQAAPHMQRPQDPLQRPAAYSRAPASRTNGPGPVAPLHPAERSPLQTKDSRAQQGPASEQNRQASLRETRPNMQRPTHSPAPQDQGQRAAPVSAPNAPMVKADAPARPRPGQHADPLMRASFDQQDNPEVPDSSKQTAHDQPESANKERVTPKHPAEEKGSGADGKSSEKQTAAAQLSTLEEAETPLQPTQKPTQASAEASEKDEDQKPAAQRQHPQQQAPQAQVSQAQASQEPKAPQTPQQNPDTPKEASPDQGAPAASQPQSPSSTPQQQQAPAESPKGDQDGQAPSLEDAKPKAEDSPSDKDDQQAEVEPLSKSASYDDEINRLLNELSSEIKK